MNTFVGECLFKSPLGWCACAWSAGLDTSCADNCVALERNAHLSPARLTGTRKVSIEFETAEEFEKASRYPSGSLTDRDLSYSDATEGAEGFDQCALNSPAASHCRDCLPFDTGDES